MPIPASVVDTLLVGGARFWAEMDRTEATISVADRFAGYRVRADAAVVVARNF